MAAIRGTESYSLLSSLNVISEINSLIEDPVLNGKKLRVLFGGVSSIDISLMIIFSTAVPSFVHGYECRTLDICLLMVYCVFRQKV